MNFKDGSNDPYIILGLPHGADFELVKAIYRSLVKIYHPDVFKGDKKFAAERLTALNSAFEFLSDPKTKKEYDRSQHQPDKKVDAGFSEGETAFDAETSSLMDSWLFACEYHPEIQSMYHDLLKLNKRPAFAFMAILVEQKLYSKAATIANYLESEFLASAFGLNKQLQKIGKAALLSKEVKYALELNQALNRLGSGSSDHILSKLSIKYPRFGYDILRKFSLDSLIDPSHPEHPNNLKKEFDEENFKQIKKTVKRDLLEAAETAKNVRTGYKYTLIFLLAVSLLYYIFP